MKNRQVRFVVMLGVISILGIISIQAYFLLHWYNIHEKQFTQTIFIGLKNVSDRLCRFNQITVPPGNPVRQITSNYYVVDVNSVIDANILEYYLKSEFEKLNIRTDYEYAIYDCHTDQMVYGNYITAGENKGNASPTTNLPKYSEYVYYFGVHFPNLKSTIAGNMTLWFLFTGILLLSVLFFAYAIIVILHQKRLSELQRDFINNMTHEFKTPIATINISADVITNPEIMKEPERLMTYGKVIRKENQRLNLLVEKVLQIARIEKGKVHLKTEPTELNLLLKTVAETFEANHAGKIMINLLLDPAVGKVNADVIHCTNIIHNLLDNGAKYSGEHPEITLGTKRNADSIQVMVRDNGPGIPYQYRNRIFDQFFRIPSGNIHDVKGFGLGLYYVRLTCKAHRWDIRLESESGRGAAFIITIPINNRVEPWKNEQESSM